MNKDGEKAAAMLNKAAGIAGVNSISGETITAQEAKLQAKIDQAKQLIKDVIGENSETRKLIDDREKAEKTMHSKESTAEKAEKKSDEKAPQYRDDANKAAEDFRLVDGQLMDRLRNWNKTRADVFSRVVTSMTEVLTAPNAVGAGSGGGAVGGGGGGGFGVVVAKSVPASQPAAVTATATAARASYSVAVPRDLGSVSRAEQESLTGRVRDTLGKAQRERDELQKLAEVLKVGWLSCSGSVLTLFLQGECFLLCHDSGNAFVCVCVCASRRSRSRCLGSLSRRRGPWAR